MPLLPLLLMLLTAHLSMAETTVSLAQRASLKWMTGVQRDRQTDTADRWSAVQALYMMTAQHNAMQVAVETYRHLRMKQQVSQCRAGRSIVQTLYMMDAGDWTAGQTHCKDGRPIIQALFPDPREVPVCSN